jgi:lauroyl/myristoyl acyltransferase
MNDSAASVHLRIRHRWWLNAALRIARVLPLPVSTFAAPLLARYGFRIEVI